MLFASMAVSAEEGSSEWVFMAAKDRAAVHRGANVDTAIYARVAEDAVVKVRLHRRMADCPSGWYARAEGGYICGRHLSPTDAQAEKPGVEDDPNLRVGSVAVMVTSRKVDVFKKKSSFLRGHSDAVLLKGSVLTTVGEEQRKGKSYYATRQGWFVPKEDCVVLNKEVSTLAIDVTGGAALPGAVVTGRDVKVYDAPSDIAKVNKTLSRWSQIPGTVTQVPKPNDAFVALPGGGYVRDDRISRYRRAPMPKHFEAGERWIAVDLEQQLVTAYEGETPVRIIPCSTGIRGNTEKGQYTISRKLKQQTMRLRNCRVRVEDVQWVMYYDEEDSIAFHSAYWHDDFGTPVSHGCVNVPPDDARWLFEWSAPKTASTDSVTVPLPRGSGTKVVVF